MAALRELAGGRADLLAEACGSWRARPGASCTSRWPARRRDRAVRPVRTPGGDTRVDRRGEQVCAIRARKSVPGVGLSDVLTPGHQGVFLRLYSSTAGAGRTASLAFCSSESGGARWASLRMYSSRRRLYLSSRCCPASVMSRLAIRSPAPGRSRPAGSSTKKQAHIPRSRYTSRRTGAARRSLVVQAAREWRHPRGIPPPWRASQSAAGTNRIHATATASTPAAIPPTSHRMPRGKAARRGGRNSARPISGAVTAAAIPPTSSRMLRGKAAQRFGISGLRNNGTAISGENDLGVVGPGRVAAVRVAHTPVSACCVELQEVSPAPLRAVSGRASWCSGRSASCGMVIASVRSRQGSAG